MLDAKIVGSVIRKYRIQQGLSQEVLSSFAQIGRTHLSAIERGARKPTMETFFRLCEAMHKKPSTVIREIEKYTESDF